MRGTDYREPTVVLPSNMSPGRIGVVTVTYNSAMVLDDFLDSLDRQEYSDFLLIAVDNASTDSTLEKLNRYPGESKRILANRENIGVARANNQGIRIAVDAGCEYVLLLNNDVVFESDLFRQLVEGLTACRASMVVPLIYFHHPADQIWAAGGGFQPFHGFRNFHWGEGEKDVGQFPEPRRIDYAPTCCVLIHRDVFGQLGLMDERFFVYSDDADFMFRARSSHLPVFFLPRARLWHKVSSLTGGIQSDFTLYHAARGRALFLYKSLGRVLGLVWIAITYALYLARPILGRDTGHRCAEKRRGLADGRLLALSRESHL